jgi:hypothetical protein
MSGVAVELKHVRLPPLEGPEPIAAATKTKEPAFSKALVPEPRCRSAWGMGSRVTAIG